MSSNTLRLLINLELKTLLIDAITSMILYEDSMYCTDQMAIDRLNRMIGEIIDGFAHTPLEDLTINDHEITDATDELSSDEYYAVSALSKIFNHLKLHPTPVPKCRITFKGVKVLNELGDVMIEFYQ